MDLHITLTDRPIDLLLPLRPAAAGRAGAIAEFCGLVRAEEYGRLIGALEYEAYAPMAERVMRNICLELARAHDCLFVHVTHRIGVVPVGEAAIRVVVGAAHRGPAFAFLAGFMDRLKADVPIWKVRALLPDGQPAPASPT